MARKKTSSQLTPKELAFVANYAGDQVAAARAAGFKNPHKNASTIYKRPRVKAAIEAKQKAIVEESGRELGKAISITRNDIINRLDTLSQNAESDSAKISALGELVDIFGLRAKDGKGDLFAGWTEEELQYYVRTGGTIPPRFRSPVGDGQSDGSSSPDPARPTPPAKRS